MSELSLIQLLAGDNYLTVNKPLCKKIGVIPAIMLSEICSMYSHFSKMKQFEEIENNSDWFYMTIEKIEEKLGITRRQQDSAIKILQDIEFIQVKVKGLPAKRYFRINLEKLLLYFICDETRVKHADKINSTKLYENAKLDCTKTPNIYKDNNIRITRSDREQDNVSRKSSQASKTLEPKTRFKLSLEQQGVVEWLKDKINTNEETLCYWAKTYEFDKIKDCFLEAVARNPKNLGAYLNKLLKENATTPKAHNQECIEFAKQFIENNPWPDAKIGKKYLTYGNNKSKSEISLNQNPQTFAIQLMDIYQNIKRKK